MPLESRVSSKLEVPKTWQDMLAFGDEQGLSWEG